MSDLTVRLPNGDRLDLRPTGRLERVEDLPPAALFTHAGQVWEKCGHDVRDCCNLSDLEDGSTPPYGAMVEPLEVDQRVPRPRVDSGDVARLLSHLRDPVRIEGRKKRRR